MPEDTNPSSAMGDIIGSTRKRLEQEKGGAETLKNLVAQIPIASEPPARSEPRPATNVPPGYFLQQSEPPSRSIAKKRPKHGPNRDETINMRATFAERDRFVTWCDLRSLSFPDGLMLLLDIAEGKVAGDK